MAWIPPDKEPLPKPPAPGGSTTTTAGGGNSGGVTLGAAAATVLGGVYKAATVALLNQTITNPPTQAEVQALTDKMDELLTALKASGTLA